MHKLAALTGRLGRLAALSALAVVLVAQPASAAPVGPETATVVAVPASNSGPVAPDSTTAITSTITCTAQIQYPHNSSHVPGTVNVVATVSCDAPVTSINMTVNLYYNAVQVASQSFSTAGSAFLQGNAAQDPCLPGAYQGTASGTIVFPPGYVPSPQSFDIASPVVPISCT